jgi:uncharacterized protein YuzE
MERYYDPTGDVLYIYLRERADGERYTTREVAPGVALDLDAQGHPIGLEVLSASKRYSAVALAQAPPLDARISLAQAAQIAGLSPRTLKIQAQSGRLQAEKLGANWVTTEAWLKAYLSSRRYNAKAI